MALPDIDDIRRLAPLHFEARAANARFAAWTLWKLSDGADPDEGKKAIGYTGSGSVALAEAWRRERSLALELIVKAVYAQRQEFEAQPRVVRATHDVLALWGEAGLPKLNQDDKLRLAVTYQLLQWAGRYAAPRAGSDGQSALIDRYLTKHHISGTLYFNRMPPFGWDEFDSLYQRANNVMWLLHHDRQHGHAPSA